MNLEIIRKHITKIEFALLIVIAIALVLSGVDAPGPLASIGMSSLAVLYFLSAYIPPEESPPDLLAIVAPKVLGIGWSVCTMGILFHLLGFPGAPSMLGIGATSVSIALVMLIFTQIKSDSFRPTISLLRSVVLIAISGFLFSQNYM